MKERAKNKLPWAIVNKGRQKSLLRKGSKRRKHIGQGPGRDDKPDDTVNGAVTMGTTLVHGRQGGILSIWLFFYCCGYSCYSRYWSCCSCGCSYGCWCSSSSVRVGVIRPIRMDHLVKWVALPWTDLVAVIVFIQFKCLSLPLLLSYHTTIPSGHCDPCLPRPSICNKALRGGESARGVKREEAGGEGCEHSHNSMSYSNPVAM